MDVHVKAEDQYTILSDIYNTNYYKLWLKQFSFKEEERQLQSPTVIDTPSSPLFHINRSQAVPTPQMMASFMS